MVRPVYSLTILILLANPLLGGSAAVGEQCVVTGVQVASDERASTYSFNLTMRNPSCSRKDGLIISRVNCGGYKQDHKLRPQDEGKITQLVLRGKWKVKVEQNEVSGVMGPVESECFPSLGLLLSPEIPLLSFTPKELTIILPTDPRVSGWCIDTYKIIEKSEAYACKYSTDFSRVQKKFRRNPHLKNRCQNSGSLKIAHDFDPDGCYCFVMKAITDLSLIPPQVLVSTNSCRSSLPLVENGKDSMAPLPLTEREKLTLALVVGLPLVTVVVVVSLLLVATRCQPQWLGDLLALRRRPAEGKKKPAPRQPLREDKGVLLLHARDTSGNKTLAILRKHLQPEFKVHDIFENGDPERLADPTGWLLAMVQQGSGVKLLLVESPALQNQVQTIVQSSTERNNLTGSGKVRAAEDSSSPVARDGDFLLTFALRQILCTDLKQNYSRVFVVRLTDAQEQGLVQYEDWLDLVVKTARYNLPCHYNRLKEDLLM